MREWRLILISLRLLKNSGHSLLEHGCEQENRLNGEKRGQQRRSGARDKAQGTRHKKDTRLKGQQGQSAKKSTLGNKVLKNLMLI